MGRSTCHSTSGWDGVRKERGERLPLAPFPDYSFRTPDTGANAEAIEHLEAYLQAMPNAPDAAQMRAKIAELRSTP